MLLIVGAVSHALHRGFAQELTEAQKQELAAREACKIKICAAIHRRNPGPDIACSVARTWPKEQVEKVVSKARITWPWGDIRCVGEVRLAREQLIAAMSTPRYEASFDRHTMACQIERGTEKTEITVEFTPKVVFENGRAAKASANWGKIEGPAAVRTALWTAAATDNALNVLQSTLVQDINDLIGPKCEALKSEWQGK